MHCSSVVPLDFGDIVLDNLHLLAGGMFFFFFLKVLIQETIRNPHGSYSLHETGIVVVTVPSIR